MGANESMRLAEPFVSFLPDLQKDFDESSLLRTTKELPVLKTHGKEPPIPVP